MSAYPVEPHKLLMNFDSALAELDQSHPIGPAGSERVGVIDWMQKLGHDYLVGGNNGSFLVKRRSEGDDTLCAIADRRIPEPSRFLARPVDTASSKAIGFLSGWQAIEGEPDVIIAGSNGLYRFNGAGENQLISKHGYYWYRTHGGPMTQVTSLGWAKQVVVIAPRELIFVSRNDQFSVHPTKLPRGYASNYDSFPGLKVAFAFGEKSLVPLTGDSAPDAVPEVIRPMLDTPWLGGALSYSYDGKVGIVRRDGTFVSKVVSGLGGQNDSLFRPSPLSRTTKAWPLTRFQTALGFRDGWFELTKNWQIRPIQFAETTAFDIATTFDPGIGAILLGTTTGLLTLDAQGKLQRPTGQGPRRTVRTIERSSAINTVLLGGDEGLFRLDGTRTSPIVDGDARNIGAIFRIADAPWLRSTFISASYGLFVIEQDGRLRKVMGVDGGEALPATIIVAPQARQLRVLAGRSYSNWQLYDLTLQSP